MTHDELIEALRDVAPVQLERLVGGNDPKAAHAAKVFLAESRKRGYWFSELVRYHDDTGLGRRFVQYGRMIIKALAEESLS